MNKRNYLYSLILFSLLVSGCSANKKPTTSEEESEPAQSEPVESEVTPESEEESEPVTSEDESGTPSEEDPSIYMITEAGEYDITSDYKQIYVNAPDAEVVINLNGVTIQNDENSPIYVETADKVEISAKKSTVNNVIDDRETYTEDVDGQGNGAIYVEDGDLKLKGAGTLNITGNYYNGIHGKDDVRIQKQTLNITAVNHAIKGNDSIEITSGTINLTCGGDGLKTENSDVSSKGNQRGDISILGGDVTINSWGDGLDASYNAIINELDASTAPLSVDIKTNKYSSYSGETVEPSTSDWYLKVSSNTYSNSYRFSAYINETWYDASLASQRQGRSGLTYYFQLEKPNEVNSFVLYYFESNSENSLTSYVAKSDAKAFNDYYDTIEVKSISNSKINFGSWSNYNSSQQGGGSGGPGGSEGNNDKADDSAKGIKAANEVNIIAGNVSIKAFDDGIHANKDETLGNGEEPLGNVNISGGTTTIEASDDGIHADAILNLTGGEVRITNSYEGYEADIINVDGTVKAYATAKDDGANAKTSINVSGGYFDITVSPNGDTDGIDSNGTYTQTGGIVIARGPGSGMASALDTDGAVSIKGGTIIVLGSIETTPSTSGVTSYSLSLHSSGTKTVTIGETEYTFNNAYSYSKTICYSDVTVSV